MGNSLLQVPREDKEVIGDGLIPAPGDLLSSSVPGGSGGVLLGLRLAVKPLPVWSMHSGFRTTARAVPLQLIIRNDGNLLVEFKQKPLQTDR